MINNTPDTIIAVLTVFGALEVSYVESVILSRSEGGTDQKRSLREIYWSDLSWKNRLLFWTGFLCMLSPVTVSVLGQLP